MRRSLRTFPVHLFAALGAMGCLVLIGCAGGGKKNRPEELPPPHVTATVVLDRAAPPGGYPDSDKALADALTANGLASAPTAAPTGRPLNILALSGGGQYGAFVAGVLCGWTETGTRPDFDICTGISSGALIATLAYLGPKYDPELRRVFTTLTGDDLFKYRPAINLVRYKSIATSEPLKKQIALSMNTQFMDDVRIAHNSGRRLFIGTMNLHSRRLVIWDVGALACSGRADADDLVRKVILAACSISGLAPPVEFEVEVNGQKYIEQHVDGGGASQVFVRFGPHQSQSAPGSKWLAGSNLYMITGGKLYADPLTGKLGFITRATGTVSATLYALYRTELMKLYALCATTGMKYHLVSVPQDKKTAIKSMSFDPAVMKDLFAFGYSYGISGIPWRYTPPGTEPGEEDKPRAGLVFEVP